MFLFNKEYFFFFNLFEYISVIYFFFFNQVSFKLESGSIGEEEDVCREGESKGGEVGFFQRGVVWFNQQVAVVVYYFFFFGQIRYRADVFDGFRGRFVSFF